MFSTGHSPYSSNRLSVSFRRPSSAQRRPLYYVPSTTYVRPSSPYNGILGRDFDRQETRHAYNCDLIDRAHSTRIRQLNHGIAQEKRYQHELELKRMEYQRQRNHEIFVRKYNRLMRKTRRRSAEKIQQCWKDYKEKKSKNYTIEEIDEPFRLPEHRRLSDSCDHVVELIEK